MEKLYLSPELRADLRARGLRNAAQFTWENALDSLWSLENGDTASFDVSDFRSSSGPAPGAIALEVS